LYYGKAVLEFQNSLKATGAGLEERLSLTSAMRFCVVLRRAS